MTKTRIAIFASGTGSNAVNLIHFFKDHSSIEVAFVLSNKSDAKVLSSAKELGVKTMYYSNAQVADGAFLTQVCADENVDWVILAGYLRLIPSELIQAFENKMINLHPSLLPNYGGKGMHGRKVHEAVLANREKESGITVHFVNEDFDKGRIIAQFHCKLESEDTVENLEGKIRYLEQRYFPTVVQNTINQ
ncbi:MAG: phosphoribosylglycinamide formyltransferase [Crocinitomicaceae bacterium]|nr:phosphoribosylglycinamide formyltransferase [Crocinitomicaceae bacterium]